MYTHTILHFAHCTVRDEQLDRQINAQQSQHLSTLRQVFGKHQMSEQRAMLDMDGLSGALSVFGMVIDLDKALQQLVWQHFDIEHNGEIDNGDFSATMSELMTSKEDSALMLLFQIFDAKQDGYLEQADVARVLLTLNHFAVVAIGGQEQTETITYTRKQCLKQARHMMQEVMQEAEAEKKRFTNMEKRTLIQKAVDKQCTILIGRIRGKSFQNGS